MYALCCVSFIIVIGGAVYEHLNVVPVWSAAPPLSLSMFQGEYGLNPALFWMLIHPVNMLLFTVILILHWKTPRRRNIVIVFTSYIIILVITAIYFVPELVSITSTPFSAEPDASLAARGKRWELLSILRLCVLVSLSIILLIGLTKESRAKTSLS